MERSTTGTTGIAIRGCMAQRQACAGAGQTGCTTNRACKPCRTKLRSQRKVLAEMRTRLASSTPHYTKVDIVQFFTGTPYVTEISTLLLFPNPRQNKPRPRRLQPFLAMKNGTPEDIGFSSSRTGQVRRAPVHFETGSVGAVVRVAKQS